MTTAPLAPLEGAPLEQFETAFASRPRRFTLPRGAAFAGTAAAFAALYLAAGAPTPLFVLFQHEWAFPEGVLTVAFAIYAVGLLAALLVFGALSDHIGRRPVLIASLSVELVAMVLFAAAPNIGWVIVARAVQGAATGAATSAFTASVVEHAPERFRRIATLITSIAPAGGLGLGALFSGFAVQFSATPALIVFVALAVVVALGLLVAVFSDETVTRRPGAIRSLIPNVKIPAAARREFTSAIPVHVAAWMLAGLFLGLAPTVVRVVFGIDSGLVQGLTVFIEPAAASLAVLALGRVSGRRTVIIGAASVLIGSIVILAGIATVSLPGLWFGGVIAGIGFGASFSGGTRLVAPLVESHERAGLFAGVFVVAYLAFGVPSIVVGELVGVVGLLAAVVAYVVAIIVAAVLAVVAQSPLAAA